MDLTQFVKETKERLGYIPLDQRLAFIKAELARIEDPAQRKDAEGLLELILTSQIDPTVEKTIILLIHGIRTQAPWQEMVREKFEEIDSNVKVIPLGYGFFDAIRFWQPLKFFRNKPINKIQEEIREIVKSYPNYKISAICHSYGTYVISKILEKNANIKLNRLVLCGSIISNNYKWKSSSQYPSIVNDVGVQDMWPVLAKSTSWDYGCSGTFGFKTHLIRDRYHDFGHSDFFEEKFVTTYWKPFLFDGQIIKGDYDSQRKYGVFQNFLSWFPLKSCLLIVLAFIYFFHFKSFRF